MLAGETGRRTGWWMVDGKWQMATGNWDELKTASEPLRELCSTGPDQHRVQVALESNLVRPPRRFSFAVRCVRFPLSGRS